MVPDLQELMDNQIEGRSVWAAYCTCTACGESYNTRKVPGLNAFYISQGDDGVTYPTRMDAELEDYWDIEVAPNDQINCPMCGCNTTVIHARNLRGGRTKQVQVATLHAIDGYAVIVYWLVQNNIQEYGCCYDAVPRHAFVLGERGGITAFSHRWNGVFGKDVPAGSWHPMKNNYDRWDNRYHDWGSINDTKVGTMLYPQELPSLIGTTGEKTGLLAYWESGNTRPVKYLKLWKRWKPVENLVNSGFSDLVANAVNCGYYDSKVELGKVLDTSKRKPYEILYMSKADFRTISQWKNKPSRWKFELWAKYRNIPGKLGAADFFREVDAFSDNGMRAAIDVMKEYGDCDLDKLRRYLEKQGYKPWEVQLLKDTRAMYRELSGRQELTEEERWPRRLQETHDRLTAQDDDTPIPVEDYRKYKNWKARVLTSGFVTALKDGYIDVFAVGGAGGAYWGGSGGGYTTTTKSVKITKGTRYELVIGSGGAPRKNGSATTGFGVTANGSPAGSKSGGPGGSGGGKGGDTTAAADMAGGSDGSDGSDGTGGPGQRTTTREFGDPSGRLYAAGGGGSSAKGGGQGGEPGAGDGSANKNGKNGDPNTG